MIRLVATILVGVQALLPPGMCLCQFVPFAATTRQTHENTLAAPPSAVAHTDTSCCLCPACRSESAPTTPADEQAAPEREAPNERHQLPTPTSPCSGCPLVSAGPAARVAVLPALEQAPLDTPAHFVVTVVEATAIRAGRPGLVMAPPTPPLFMRHCALLI